MTALSRKLTAFALGLSFAIGSTLLPGAAEAQTRDKVTMGLFISSSAMPYFIARERGYFAAENLEVEGIPLANHPLIVQGLVKGDLEFTEYRQIFAHCRIDRGPWHLVPYTLLPPAV